MKKVFNKNYVLQNGDCYSDRRIAKLTSPKSDNDKIHIHEILDTSIPLVDKYWFVSKHCGLKKKQIGQAVMHCADTVMKHYRELSPDLKTKVDIDDMLRIIKQSYFDSKKFNDVVIPYREILIDVAAESINDTKYITLGLINLIDLVGLILDDDDNVKILDKSNETLKLFIKSVVSKPELKEEMLNYLKNLTK